jgi:hypothetical protein
MAKIALSGSEKSIEDIWNWYEDQKKALRDYEYKIRSLVGNPQATIDDKFIGMTLGELTNYFAISFEELRHLVALDLITATEATLKTDYFTKVFNKDKTALGREFRAIYKVQQDKVKLEQDIIDNWKKYVPQCKSDFSSLVGLLKYRHWLAHGRFWLSKQGQFYSVYDVYDIAKSIFKWIG